eukprot:GGOE01011071.1.p6 GENE.GGOE01011071.1~~GGOE01011071.1.p6  ORF type:complete len:122 (-),score=3.43 GGOE01011071.1:326-691(-)
MTFLGSASPTASSHFPTNRALVISHECSPDIPAVGLAANILPLSGGGPEEDGWLQWCGGSALPFHPGCLAWPRSAASAGSTQALLCPQCAIPRRCVLDWRRARALVTSSVRAHMRSHGIVG